MHPSTDPPAQWATDEPGVEALLEAALSSTDERRAARLRKEAVVRSLDVADRLALRLRGRGIEVDDLVQVARMALVKAALRYRPGLGTCFAAYASATITGELKRHFRDHGWAVRPPRRLQELRAELAVESERMGHEFQRLPTVPELAEAMAVESDEVRAALACSAAYHTVSLSAPTTSGAALNDQLAHPNDRFQALETSAALGSLIAELDERQRKILTMRFVEEMTQAQIGREIGVSQMQVSRLLSGILGRLREGMEDVSETA
ncbi:MAG: sigma-70 family RNA polymerase sigma factor [Nostocoides sp.]